MAIKTATILAIGDEILSGRTQDTNSNTLAKTLGGHGVQVIEVRVVPDTEAEIIAAVNALRAKADYLFTTGGIGPTHDDITADSVSRAMGVEIEVNEDALAMLHEYYDPRGEEVNAARQRMARIPAGASLIRNDISGAPGFQIENVYVMAGVPKIMRNMLTYVLEGLEGGRAMASVEIDTNLPESRLAKALGDLVRDYPDVSFGSYPYHDGSGWKAKIVVRCFDEARLDEARGSVEEMVDKMEGQEFTPGP